MDARFLLVFALSSSFAEPFGTRKEIDDPGAQCVPQANMKSIIPPALNANPPYANL